MTHGWRDRRLRRELLAALLVVVMAPVVAFVALWLWVQATSGHPPDLFADVPQDFRDHAPWRARMALVFPSRTPESVLIDRLREDGFEINIADRSARYDWNTIVCNHTVEASWSANDGRVTDTAARYLNACV